MINLNLLINYPKGKLIKGNKMMGLFMQLEKSRNLLLFAIKNQKGE